VIEAPVLDIDVHPNDNFIIAIEDSELAHTTRPGQFVMVGPQVAETIPYPLLKRALAVYRTGQGPEGVGAAFFLIKVVGEGTRQLASLNRGDLVDLIGPLGNGFDLERAKGRVNFLVVGGTGIASVYLLAEYLRQYGEEIHLIYGGQTADDLVGLDDFERLEIPIVVATDDGSQGFHGLVTDAFFKHLKSFPLDRSNIYTCGPNPMMQTVTEFAKAEGIPCQLSVESKMGCGFGVCLGCSVMTTAANRLACTDGPVFDATEFIWERPFATVLSQE
jgi:dihydroorotate dehydrogenase electron transfer subunit